jgi:Homing endonuclease associated repeat
MSDGQEQHDVIALLKELALDLGRSPRQEDLIGTKISIHRVKRAFGTFAVAMKAAGLELNRNGPKPRKVTNDIFETPIEPHLIAEHERQARARFSNFVLPIEDYPTTVVLGDFHAPFHHAEATKWAIDYIAWRKPKRVVQGGDLRDMFSASKFPRSHNLFTPKEEIEAGTKACTELWARIREAVPGVECFQLLGNHDVRPYKRVLEACPELEMFIDLKPLYTFPGVRLIEDPREELELDGVFFHHGYLTRLGANRDFMNACTVNFHTHKGGVVYRAIFGGHIIWELNGGFLGDPQSKGLAYTPQKHHHQTIGIGEIDRWGPRFIPWQPKRK